MILVFVNTSNDIIGDSCIQCRIPFVGENVHVHMITFSLRKRYY